jgi:ABC-type glycerol-3-phosphate transport system substrate-binding protein
MFEKTMARRVNRRSFLAGLGATAALPILAACQPEVVEVEKEVVVTQIVEKEVTVAPAAREDITLRAIIFPYPPTIAVRDQLPTYKRLTGITVEWEEFGGQDMVTRQIAELQTGSDRYDIFIIGVRSIAPLAGSGGMLPLDDLIKAAGSDLDWEDFIPKQTEMFSYGGNSYGLPISSNVFMCGYRKDIFEAEGIKVPPLGSAFKADEWLDIIKKVHKPPDMAGTVFHNGGIQMWGPVLVSAGGRFFDEKMTPTFNSEEGVLAADYVGEAHESGTPGMIGLSNPEANEIYLQGKAASICPHWVSRIPMTLNKEKSQVLGNVDWTTLPYGGLAPGIDIGQGFNDGWAFGLVKASKNIQEAFDFGVWAVNPDLQSQILVDSNVAPPRKSVFAKNAELEQFWWLPVMGVQLDNTYDVPRIPEWTEIVNRSNKTLEEIWGGRASSIQEALDSINEVVTKLMKERGYPVGTYEGERLPWE